MSSDKTIINRKGEFSLKRLFIKILLYAIFILFTITTVLPLVWLLFSSLKNNSAIVDNPLAFPKTFNIGNYFNAINEGNLALYARNSVIYTTASTVVTIFIALMAAFSFAKFKNRFNMILYRIFFIGLLITVHSIMIPLFIAIKGLRLYDNHLGIILVYVAINLPLSIYLATEYIKLIPDSLIDSARIDGAGYWWIFHRIIVPICNPVIVTIAIITGLNCWNEFVMAFILSASEATRSLPVGIIFFSGPSSMEYGMQFAALVIATLPLILFYINFYTKVTEGMAEGALQG